MKRAVVRKLNAYYIGQTGRTLQERCNEHKKHNISPTKAIQIMLTN